LIFLRKEVTSLAVIVRGYSGKQINKKGNMRITGFLTLILGFIFLSCNQSNSAKKTTIEKTENLQQVETVQEIDNSKDKEEIQNLIRQTLNWADSENVIDILPMLLDSRDSIYIGFDLNRHETNLAKLRAIGFFANEFIENYNRIILTLDKMLRNNEFEEWLVGDLPTFRFANGANPWCACQDVPYDNPSPWDYVEIKIIELNNDRAQLAWKWGELDSNTHFSWEDFSYKFGTVKENGKWKIAYLQEFDFEKSIQQDGI